VDPVTLWLIVGGVILVAFILVGLVAVNRRSALGRRQKLELPNAPVGEGRAEPAQDAGDSPNTFAEAAASGPVLELERPEVAEPEPLLVERPEAT
jgi:fused signal recognition particle receptor